MPAISAPGFKRIRRCIDRALEVTVLPGPSAGETALVAAHDDGQGLSDDELTSIAMVLLALICGCVMLAVTLVTMETQD